MAVGCIMALVGAACVPPADGGHGRHAQRTMLQHWCTLNLPWLRMAAWPAFHQFPVSYCPTRAVQVGFTMYSHTKIRGFREVAASSPLASSGSGSVPDLHKGLPQAERGEQANAKPS